MKKTVSVLLAVILLLSLIPVYADENTTINSDSVQIRVFFAEPVTVDSVTAEAKAVLKGKPLAMTVQTSANASFLNAYAANGKLIKSWDAATYSKEASSARTWSVPVTIKTAGKQTVTFKAADANKKEGSQTQSISYTVEETGVTAVGVKAGTVQKQVEAQKFTVKTNAAAKYVMMYTENGKLAKTYDAATYSTVSGDVRTWTISQKFNDAGTRIMTFKSANGDKTVSSLSKSAIFDVASADVLSVTIERPIILKGQTQEFTVRTGSAAKVLQMFDGSSTKAYKTWKAADYSVLDGTERIWTVEVKYSGAGSRTSVFKAGKSTSKLSTVTQSVKFTVKNTTEGVASVSLTSESMPKGQNQVFTIRTDKAAQYLMMYIEDGSLFRTWTANQDSVVQGNERVWTIVMKFSGAGNRTITFKAAKADKTPYALSKTVKFSVLKNDVGVMEVKVADPVMLKGQKQVFTVRTSANAKYLMMYNGSDTKAYKTWAADDKNSVVNGTERVWTVSMAFNGAGNRTQVFKAGKTKDAPSAVSQSVKFTVDKNDTGVISVKTVNVAAVKGQEFGFTVVTNADAKYLMMYVESGKLFKTWEADKNNSKVSGTQRIWNISMAFNGVGARTLSFKAGKTIDSPTTAGKTADFKVESYGVVSAEAASEKIAKKKDLTFTVKTPSDAKYLMLYTETGSKAKSWAASGNSKVSGKVRIWTVSMSFSGAGDRVLTFRTGTTTTPTGLGAEVAFTVVPDEFEISKGVLVSYNGSDTEVTVPAGKGITTIGKDAFRGNHTVTKIILPSGVTTIQERAFEYCDALKSVEVQKTLKTIGAYAFNQCVKLTEIKNLKTTALTAIAEGTFLECKAMQSISLPDTITKIGKRAFYNCTSLKNMD